MMVPSNGKNKVINIAVFINIPFFGLIEILYNPYSIFTIVKKCEEKMQCQEKILDTAFLLW